MSDNNKAKLDPRTEKNLRMWLEGNVDEPIKVEIRRLLESNPLEVIDAFYTQLTFGTGGLRGLMGNGTNRMNVYTVRMATQGLANYLAKQPVPSEGHAVIIGYDSRHNSKAFAEEAAKVLAGNQIRVYLFSELRPTPLVSFGCRQMHCSAAIMVTASHNPPQYNGYKVYWKGGGQVTPPHDKGIIQEVEAITQLSMVKSADSISSPMVTLVDPAFDQTYLEAIASYPFYPEENREHGKNLKIVYTSLHGTGITLVPRVLKEWGFINLTLVDSQVLPDGSFPTVKQPNPEEREALAVGIQKLQEIDGDLLVATDPDADRVGVAVMHQGKPKMLNGNQIACVCLHHICEALTNLKRMPKNAAFVKTIATTELFRIIAEAYGGTCFDVLTGFKYIAEKIEEWEGKDGGYRYVFGGEESYGYLLGTHCRDKDAVVSCALLAETALHAKMQEKTLIDLLYDIYRRFGVFYESLETIAFAETKQGREQMAKGMEKLQNAPPKKINNIEVETIEDYNLSRKTDLSTGKATPLLLPASNALLLWLKDGTKLLIRPSGTEPKIKIYCGLAEKEIKNVDQAVERCKVRSQEILGEIKDSFF